jgi:16S rRNA (cytosine1402-N4)-methyltransferase
MSDPAIEYHHPVLLAPILARARDARRVVDATLGDGGHTAGFLAQGAEVLAIDRDPDAVATARRRLGDDRVEYLEAPFGGPSTLDKVARFHPDFVLLDLGVSSRQLDQARRGFTFRRGVPLDMRMGGPGETAADWLAGADVDTMAGAFREFADERRALRLAREISRRRETAPLAASDDLVNAIRAALGSRSGPADFARIFQAVRIAVNDESGQLQRALPAFRDALVPGGTLAVISYHSGEDRLVKTAFREWGVGCTCPPGLPQCVCGNEPLGVAEPRRAIRPPAEEIAMNPRARSARLRFFRVRDAD